MDREARRRLRERGVLLATAGLCVALLVGLIFKLFGIIQVSLSALAALLAITLAVQALMWLVPHRGWDERLSWDPHFQILPMLSYILLLNVYLFFSPATRQLVLMAWFIALLFLAGTAGMGEVVLLAALMAGGYVTALALSPWRPPEATLIDAMAMAVVFWFINVYAGVLFRRLKRERSEMKSLRHRLSELALTDSLTGLPNRRRFEEALAAERARAERYGGRFCVAMLDVDHFKNYNDRRGHPAGDDLLRQLGDTLRAGLRTGDLMARYGGEEFAALMLNTGRTEALHVLDRLRGMVENMAFEGREVQPGGRLTISAGLSEWPEGGRDEEALLASADTALYRAKAAGRNRVVVSEPLALDGSYS